MEQIPYFSGQIEFDYRLVHGIEASKDYLALVANKMKSVLDHALLVAKQASNKE